MAGTWRGNYFAQLDLGTDEIKDVSRDFASEITDAAGVVVASITSFNVSSDPEGLTITNKAEDGGIVSCQIANPTKATSYDLWFQARISNGNNIVPDPILINCPEKPAGDAIVPPITPFELNFAVNTFITVPVVIDHSQIFTVEYEVLTSNNTVTQHAWRSTGSGGDTHHSRLNSGNEWNFRKNQNRQLALILANSEYKRFIEEWTPAPPGGSLTVTAGTQTLGTSFSLGTTLAPQFTIGGDQGQSWQGTIRDFKILNSSQTLIHHWPIDDLSLDGGSIRDIVGGASGILTLGAGSWQARG